MLRKLKNFIHKNKFLDKLLFSVWGIFWIIRGQFILRKIKRLSNNREIKRLKVIIPAIRAIPTTNLVWFDAVFGHVFRKLGAEVKMIYCDGLMDSCDADTVFRDQKTPCFTCKLFGNRVRKVLGLDFALYKDYVSESDVEGIKKEVANLKDDELTNHRYLGIDVGTSAHSSAIRYFLFGKLDFNDPAQTKMLRDKLVLAMINTKVAKEVVVQERPDFFFMLHGNYSTWGPFYSYPRSQGIETIIYSNLPPRFGHFILHRNRKEGSIASQEKWDKIKYVPLTEKENQEIDDYFSQRFKGNNQEMKMYSENFNKNIKLQSGLSFLQDKQYTKRFIMFPNLAWDAQIEGDISDIFEDVFQWIDKTIEFFQNKSSTFRGGDRKVLDKKDYQLIIKPHPAENVWERCSKGISDYIKEKYSPLPENIVLLPSTIPLRAYDLIKPEIIAIVYNGTLGLELSANATPVLAAANVHYKDADVVYKVDSQIEYFNLLENPNSLIQFTKDNLEIARRYAHFYFFKAMIRVPFYRDDKWAVIDWSKVRNTKELFSEDSNVMKICKRIINKQDVVEPL